MENEIPFYLQNPKKEPATTNPNSPSLGGGWGEAMQEQAARHEAEYAKEEAFWKKTYDDMVAEKANLYKADPKLAENKRKEAALKTLVSAFGSLADTIAVANGGTAPLRDYRQDISQTHQQADALDQGERAKEAAAYQNYLDRLEKLVNKRPKWKQNDALLKYADMISRDDDRERKFAFQKELQKKRDDAAMERAKIAQQGANQRTAATIAAKKGGTQKTERAPYTTISTDVGEGTKSYRLDQGQASKLFEVIKSRRGYNPKTGQHEDMDIELMAQSLKNGGSISKTQIDNVIARYIDNDDYPELKKILKDMVRDFQGLNGSRADTNVPSVSNAPTDAQGNPLSEIY